MADLHFMAGDRVKAARTLERVTSRDPQNGRFLLRIAEHQKEVGPPSAAIDAYQRYLATNADNSKAQAALVSILHTSGRTEDAMEHVDGGSPGSEPVLSWPRAPRSGRRRAGARSGRL